VALDGCCCLPGRRQRSQGAVAACNRQSLCRKLLYRGVRPLWSARSTAALASINSCEHSRLSWSQATKRQECNRREEP